MILTIFYYYYEANIFAVVSRKTIIISSEIYVLATRIRLVEPGAQLCPQLRKSKNFPTMHNTINRALYVVRYRIHSI